MDRVISSVLVTTRLWNPISKLLLLTPTLAGIATKTFYMLQEVATIAIKQL